MGEAFQTVVIGVTAGGILLSLTRFFSPLSVAREIGRVGGWFDHAEDVALDAGPDGNVNDPPIPLRPLRSHEYAAPRDGRGAPSLRGTRSLPGDVTADPPVPPARAYPPPARGEWHWPAQLTVAGAIVLQVTLPDRLRFGPLWLLPGLETIMLLGLVAASPQRLAGEYSVRRRAAITIAAVVSVANAISLGLLSHYLFSHKVSDGHALIVAGSEIWLTNVLIFSLWYWEVDRGGPGRRAAGRDAAPDFLFPQMSDDTIEPRGWRPQFVDYLYVSLTNATAFSPTDTMPLTPTAKSMMGLQSIVSLVTIGLVVSRAVNIL